MQYVRDKRPTVGGWTVDRSGRAQRGDLILLYGTGQLQSCVAIARVCSESVREWWGYLQIQPLAQPVPRATSEALPVAPATWIGLQQPRGSRANLVAAVAAEAALQLLTQNDPRAAARLRT